MYSVLAVDDDPVNLEILCEYLSERNYKAITANNGEEAWNILNTRPFEISAVLLDRMMPEMNGMDLLEKIRKTKSFQGLPVIMQTAASSQQEMVEGLKAGAYYYLTKPFDREVLLSIVDTAVTDWRHFQTLRTELQKGMSTMSLMNRGEFQFRTIEESHSLAAFIANGCPDSERVVLGLSELMINAVEHGNLGITYDEKTALLESGRWLEEVRQRLSSQTYRDKQVEVQFIRTDAQLQVVIRDQGEGFDWGKYKEMAPDRLTHRHGRGIAMANLMSFDQVNYNDSGNEVTCVILSN